MKNHVIELVLLIVVMGFLISSPNVNAVSPETLWSDGCNSLDGWTGRSEAPYGSGSCEVYTGTYVEAPASFRLYAFTLSSDAGTSYTIRRPLSANVTEDMRGRLNYVLGFSIKLKSIARYGSHGYGGAYVYLNDVYGNKIAGISILKTIFEPIGGGIGLSGINGGTGSLYTLSFDKWYNIELLVGPQSSQLFIDGTNIGNSTLITMGNNTPTEIVIRSLADSSPGATEFFTDKMYIAAAPIGFNWALLLLIGALILILLGGIIR